MPVTWYLRYDRWDLYRIRTGRHFPLCSFSCTGIRQLQVIRGVSKFFAAPGLRFGYGLTSNQAFLQTLLTHQNPWSLNSVGAYAGERMLKDTDYIKKTWTLIDSERTRMCKELSELDTVKIYPAYANFVLVRILKEGLTSFRCLLKKRFTRISWSGTVLLSKAWTEEYVRFCIMNPEDKWPAAGCIPFIIINAENLPLAASSECMAIQTPVCGPVSFLKWSQLQTGVFHIFQYYFFKINAIKVSSSSPVFLIPCASPSLHRNKSPGFAGCFSPLSS